MRGKSNCWSLNKITSDVGTLTKNTIKSTQGFVKNVSKEMSEIELEKMYKNTQKSLKASLREGSKDLNRLVKKYKKSEVHRVLSKDVPKQFTLITGWSSKQLGKFEKVTTKSFSQSKRWVKKRYPEFRKSLMSVYPKVEAIVMPSSKSSFSLKFSR